MREALLHRDDVDRYYVSRKEGFRELASIQDSVDSKKSLRRTDYSYKQHKHQQTDNKQKTKMGRKTNVWTFQRTNKRNLSREVLDKAEKGKLKERNWIISDSRAKQRLKN